MISIHLMLLFIIEPLLRMCMYMYFNTSHVTVYHYPGFFCSALRKFQYISCYCLSQGNTVKEGANKKISIHLMLLFIAVTLGMTTRCLNFNTSHVTVYQSGSPYLSTVPRFQYISCYCLSDSHCMSLETQWYFNTSHVTVYLCISIPECVYIRISIHLMLLFIRDIIKQAKKFGIFQYISCYCLSLQGKLLQFV